MNNNFKEKLKSLLGSLPVSFIVVKLNGRLGNHFFQYAFAKATGKRLNCFYVIDDSQTKDVFRSYFERQSLADIPLLRSFFLRLFSFKIYQKRVIQSGLDECKTVKEECNINCCYDGYFQSVEYFEELQAKVKREFRIKRKYRQQFRRLYGDLFKRSKVLVIHRRVGDYLQWGFDYLGGVNLSLPFEYYKRAIESVPDLGIYKILVVTDDPQVAKHEFSDIPEIQIISDSEIMDFMLLMHADVLILANSSFSWWASYLNKRANLVIAPKYWLGFKVQREFPNGIFRTDFKAVDVLN